MKNYKRIIVIYWNTNPRQWCQKIVSLFSCDGKCTNHNVASNKIIVLLKEFVQYKIITTIIINSYLRTISISYAFSLKLICIYKSLCFMDFKILFCLIYCLPLFLSFQLFRIARFVSYFVACCPFDIFCPISFHIFILAYLSYNLFPILY